MIDEIIAPLFTTTWGKRLAWGSLIILCVLLVMIVIGTFTDWYHDFIGIHHQAKKKSNLAADDVAQLIARVPEEHMFGKFGALDNSDLPITSLQLHLVGVIKAVPEKMSRVILSEGGKPSKVYQVGDSLSSDVRIYAITQDGVILENGGRLEKLPLQRPSLEFQGMPKSFLTDQAQGE